MVEKMSEADSHVPVPTRLADLETHIERERVVKTGKMRYNR